jgi:hypothetical protein
VQTISTNKKIPLALAVSMFPGTQGKPNSTYATASQRTDCPLYLRILLRPVPILSLATTDRKIQIFAFQPESAQVSRPQSWVLPTVS